MCYNTLYVSFLYFIVNSFYRMRRKVLFRGEQNADKQAHTQINKHIQTSEQETNQ